MALFNEAMTMIFREVDPTGLGGEVREQLESFATGAGVYNTLFRRAGPAPDGTVIAEKILENISTLVGRTHAETTLAQWLYEYVSFAVFVAEPYVRPGSNAGTSLTKRIAELVGPLAPKV